MTTFNNFGITFSYHGAFLSQQGFTHMVPVLPVLSLELTSAQCESITDKRSAGSQFFLITHIGAAHYPRIKTIHPM